MAENGIVLLTRVPSAGGPLLAAAARLRHEPLVIPVLSFGEGRDRPRFRELLSKGSWDWIAMTSRKAAEALLEVRDEGARLPRGVKIAVVGEGTAEVLRRGGIAVDLHGDEPNASSLADAIARVKDVRAVLFLRGRRSRRELPERLAAAGVAVEELEVYTTEAAEFDAAPIRNALAAGQLAASVVSSPSAAEAIRGALGEAAWVKWLDLPIVVPGATTARALESLGATCVTIARTPLEDGVAEALLALLSLGESAKSARSAGAPGGAR
ncbi:MAG: uroporphyrinogen-III synthase [bacterium]